MAAITLRENPGQTVVTDSCTSNGLAAFIAGLGGRHFRRARRERPGPLLWEGGGTLRGRGSVCCLPAKGLDVGATRSSAS